MHTHFTTTVVQPKCSHVTTYVQKPSRTHLFSYTHTHTLEVDTGRAPNNMSHTTLPNHVGHAFFGARTEWTSKVCECMKKDVLVVFWTWVVTWLHLGCTTVVIKVCMHSPRDLAVWWVTYVLVLGRCELSNCILTFSSGIAPIIRVLEHVGVLEHVWFSLTHVFFSFFSLCIRIWR